MEKEPEMCGEAEAKGLSEREKGLPERERTIDNGFGFLVT